MGARTVVIWLRLLVAITLADMGPGLPGIHVDPKSWAGLEWL